MSQEYEIISQALSIVGFESGTSTSQTLRSEPMIKFYYYMIQFVSFLIVWDTYAKSLESHVAYPRIQKVSYDFIKFQKYP